MRKKMRKKYKNYAICTLMKRVKCKKIQKNNKHSNQFIKSQKKIKTTVTQFKQSLIQHYTSLLSHTNEVVQFMYAQIRQDI